MNEFLKENLKTAMYLIMVFLLVHTLFFIAYSYLMCGDAFLALKNFYYLTYDITI